MKSSINPLIHLNNFYFLSFQRLTWLIQEFYNQSLKSSVFTEKVQQTESDRLSIIDVFTKTEEDRPPSHLLHYQPCYTSYQAPQVRVSHKNKPCFNTQQEAFTLTINIQLSQADRQSNLLKFNKVWKSIQPSSLFCSADNSVVLKRSRNSQWRQL